MWLNTTMPLRHRSARREVSKLAGVMPSTAKNLRLAEPQGEFPERSCPSRADQVRGRPALGTVCWTRGVREIKHAVVGFFAGVLSIRYPVQCSARNPTPGGGRRNAPEANC